MRDPDGAGYKWPRVEQRAELPFSRRDPPVLRGRHGISQGTGGERFQVLGGHATGLRSRLSHFRLWPKQKRNGLLCVQEELGVRTDTAALRVSALSTS